MDLWLDNSVIHTIQCAPGYERLLCCPWGLCGIPHWRQKKQIFQITQRCQPLEIWNLEPLLSHYIFCLSKHHQPTPLLMHYCWQLNASVAWNLGARAREQGWCKVESTLPPPMWPRFESWCWHHMWVEFVVGFLPCSERFFSWYFCFPLSLKNNTSKFQFNLECTDTVSMSSMQLLSVCAPRVNRKKKQTKKKRAYKLLRQFLCWIMLAQLLHSCQNKKLMDITMSKLKWDQMRDTNSHLLYIHINPTYCFSA